LNRGLVERSRLRLRKAGQKDSDGYSFWGQNLGPTIDETLKSNAGSHSEAVGEKGMSGGSVKAPPRSSGLARGSLKPKRGSGAAGAKHFGLRYGSSSGSKPCSWGLKSWRCWGNSAAGSSG